MSCASALTYYHLADSSRLESPLGIYPENEKLISLHMREYEIKNVALLQGHFFE
jgi:hypothetical protein